MADVLLPRMTYGQKNENENENEHVFGVLGIQIMIYIESLRVLASELSVRERMNTTSFQAENYNDLPSNSVTGENIVPMYNFLNILSFHITSFRQHLSAPLVSICSHRIPPNWPNHMAHKSNRGTSFWACEPLAFRRFPYPGRYTTVAASSF